MVACALFFAFTVAKLIFIVGTAKPDPTKVAARKHEDAQLNAYLAAEIEVEKRLKSPSTAKFPLPGSGALVNERDGHFFIQSYVDSQNTFGGMMRTKWTAKVDSIPGSTDVMVREVHVGE